MNESKIKKEIVDVCHRLYDNKFICAYDGNVSVRADKNRIITTPSGLCKGMITEDDLIVMDLDGKKISGKLNPTSENALHVTAYKLREDINAVVHAHPPMAVAFSIAGVSLSEPVLPEIVFSIGSIPIADYATPTTTEVPASIDDLIKKHDALILEKHGTLTVGKTVLDAYFKIEKIEHCASVIYHARNLGNVSILKPEQVNELMKISDKLGFKRPELIS